MEKALNMDFLLNYPAVMATNIKNTKYSGFIFIHNIAYPININMNSKSQQLKMHEKLKPFEEDITRCLQAETFSHPVQILRKLTEIIQAKTSRKTLNIQTEIYRTILQEYFEFHNYYGHIVTSNISSDLSHITLIKQDASCREHAITIAVNHDGSSKLFNVTDWDLPIENIQAENSLLGIYEKFCGFMEEFQMFFNLMDEIDNVCWVLDPEKPNRRDVHRRIALSEVASIVVTFNPRNVNEMPQIKILGPQIIVKNFSEKINSNFINWHVDEHVLDSILVLLGVDEFPAKPIGNEDDDMLLVNAGECCICFMARWEDKLPEVVCSNPSCNQVYHTKCLYQYLCSCNSRKFYFEIFGQCPNCEKPIHCALPENEK